MAEQETPGGTHQKEFTVIVNTRDKVVTSDILTYDEVVLLAFDPVPTDKDITVSFRDAVHPKQGSLQPGESVKIEHQGTSFIVTATNKA